MRAIDGTQANVSTFETTGRTSTDTTLKPAAGDVAPQNGMERKFNNHVNSSTKSNP